VALSEECEYQAGSVSMVIAGSDHGYFAGGNATIVRFEPLEFMLNSRANVIRRFASLECYLKRNLHFSLSWNRQADIRNDQFTALDTVASPNAASGDICRAQ
jgi:hypothetical protein